MDGNKHFKNYEDKYIIGKSDQASDEYDELIFAFSSIGGIIMVLILIPPSLEKIKEEWFDDSNLRDVQILGNNPNIKCYENKCIISKSDTKSDVFDLLCFVNRDITETVTIPLSTTIIFSEAFASCKIKNIKVPSSVTEIHKIVSFLI